MAVGAGTSVVLACTGGALAALADGAQAPGRLAGGAQALAIMAGGAGASGIFTQLLASTSTGTKDRDPLHSLDLGRPNDGASGAS